MNDEWRRIVRFLTAGAVNTGFGYVSYAAFVLAGAPLWLAVAGSTTLGMLFNFFNYGSFVFGNRSLGGLPRFLLLNIAIGAINLFMLRLLGGFGLGPLTAQAALVPFLAGAGYIGMRGFVFNSDPRPVGVQAIASHFVEEVKPIPARRNVTAWGRAAFTLRVAVDLQLLTCVRFLTPLLSAMHGRVLDVGCGEMPFRSLLAEDATYTGIDVKSAHDFGMSRHVDVIEFDGFHIPFADDSFDNVLCTEVLEHAEDPHALIAEMRRVLKPGGRLVATIPFSARVHHAPHDFHRFTRFALDRMFAGFAQVHIAERGDDLSAIANKLIVVCMRLSPPTYWARAPLLLLAGPVALLFLVLAHVSMHFGWGSKADPLGYGISARKD